MILSNRRAPKFDSADKGNTIIFVYGTLMHPRSRDLALHHKEKASKAIIKGYKKSEYTTQDGRDFGTIEKSNDKDTINGDIFMVGPDDFERLKQWENLYHVIPVSLNDGSQAYAFQLNEEAKIKKE